MRTASVLLFLVLSLAANSAEPDAEPDYELMATNLLAGADGRINIAFHELHKFRTLKPYFDSTVSVGNYQLYSLYKACKFHSLKDRRAVIASKEQRLLSLKAKRFAKDFELATCNQNLLIHWFLNHHSGRNIQEQATKASSQIGRKRPSWIGKLADTDYPVPSLWIDPWIKSSKYIMPDPVKIEWSKPIKAEVIDVWQDDRVLLTLKWLKPVEPLEDFEVPVYFSPSVAILEHAPPEYQQHGFEFSIPLYHTRRAMSH